VLGTSDADGRCDVSPKGDAPGFVKVLDEKRLAIPDRLGNNRLDGMLNVIANPHIGLIFMIPGRDDTLRVNGKAWIIEDGEVLDTMVVQGKRPDFAIGVEVEQAFVHCPKAFRRAKLWKSETWPGTTDAPSMAKILWDQLPAGTAGYPTCDEFETQLDARQTVLY
jgi:PPOX class probable FMN-dependent enzyme